MLSKREQLLEILFRTSFNANPTPIYRLASGIVSRYYIDCRVAVSYPEARALIGELLFERIQDLHADAVGGLALGAYPIAIAVSDAAYTKGITLRAFVIRKESKTHGLRRHIEGEVKGGDRVVIVDDVITTGNSTIDAIQKSRDEDLKVVKAIALVDRQEANGKENIEQHQIDFEALFTLQDFKALLGEK
ncbi:MAG: orotate phosphoribosyltransferase [Candidatus Methylomirabilales bacterium]